MGLRRIFDGNPTSDAAMQPFTVTYQEHVMNRYWKIGAFVALGMLSAGTASASTLSLDASAAVAHCATLPLSQRGICKTSAMNSNAGAVPTGIAEQQGRLVAQDNSRYEQAMAACRRLGYSQYNTCVDLAQRQRPQERLQASAADGNRVQAENRRYLADLKQCARLPLSEQNSCASLSGTSQALAPTG